MDTESVDATQNITAGEVAEMEVEIVDKIPMSGGNKVADDDDDVTVVTPKSASIIRKSQIDHTQEWLDKESVLMTDITATIMEKNIEARSDLMMRLAKINKEPHPPKRIAQMKLLLKQMNGQNTRIVVSNLSPTSKILKSHQKDTHVCIHDQCSNLKYGEALKLVFEHKQNCKKCKENDIYVQFYFK